MVYRRRISRKDKLGVFVTHDGKMINWNKIQKRGKEMSQAVTENADCTFETKDYSDGTFWIYTNIEKPGLPTIGKGSFIGFHFRKKMTMKEADDFARLLREKIGGVSLTKFL
jgi:hypothetical protein